MRSLKYWLDDLLARLTMYHVVVQGLVVLLLVSLALMITGYLEYSPASFLLSILLFTVSSYASNRLFGWLFGVKPHAESAVITGLILALLFSPLTSLIIGVKFVIIAVIAMASKYVLAVRGKHVFNPVAVAIVIASVSGLAYASWWIATPALLPFTILVSTLVLYKTQKILMAVVFLGVAIPLVLVQTALAGPLTVAAATAALTSWPLIFFAGIMLSEPQTLPPRRKQQFVVAIVVAVLMVIPFHYSSLTMTPALALILGNALAFYYGIRRGITLRLVDTKRMGRDGYELTFDTKALPFMPGQYVEVSLPHKHMDIRGMRRVFTLVGSPNAEQVSIATRVPEKASSFKRALIGMKKGQIVYGTRVAGDFVRPDDPKAPIVFIAGGIGITPLISFLASGKSRNITLIYVVSSVADIMFVSELRRYELRVIIVTQDAAALPESTWEKALGRLDRPLLSNYISADTHFHVYISGPPKMVDNTKRWVRELGIDSIHTDHFTGY